MNNNLIKQLIEEYSETVKKFDSSKIDKAFKIMIDASIMVRKPGTGTVNIEELNIEAIDD